MMLLRKVCVLLLLPAILFSCKHKKKPSLSGEEPVEVSDFIEFFQPLPLSYQYGDTSLAKKENDSLLISYKIFTQFVPDSVFHPYYSRNIKPKIYPLGRAEMNKAETYLFVKTVYGEKRAVYLVVFDRKHNYTASMVLLQPDQHANTTQSFQMDKRGTITKSVSRKNADGSVNEGKDVYTYMADTHGFNLIMTDALEDKPTELINPIDTLTRKYKYAGDYTTGKMNLVSIRDGRKGDRISFFIHFEKSKDCSGELKGEAFIRSANTAEYNRDGDPCKLKFIFSSSTVTLKEEEGCGSYRPLNCVFDQQFPKKKEVKKKIKTKR